MAEDKQPDRNPEDTAEFDIPAELAGYRPLLRDDVNGHAEDWPKGDFGRWPGSEARRDAEP